MIHEMEKKKKPKDHSKCKTKKKKIDFKYTIAFLEENDEIWKQT